jgi:mitochondrial import inner membrane translocase subunit TIM50
MAFIEKNKPEFERLIEQDKAAMAGQMPDNLFGVLGAIVGGRPGREKEGEGGGEEGKSGDGEEGKSEEGEGEVKVTKT